jgi:hypothetical protein
MEATKQEVAPTVDQVDRVSLTALSLASQPPADDPNLVPSPIDGPIEADPKPEPSVAKEASEKASEPKK